MKYVVLMTDGENVRGRRIRDNRYDTLEWVETWAEYPMDWWRNNIDTTGQSRGNLTYYPNTTAQQDTWMQQTCTAAREAGMTVFTIAMGSTSHGETEMAKCASSSSHAFKTRFTSEDGDGGIDEIFEQIAKQITDLRLSL